MSSGAGEGCYGTWCSPPLRAPGATEKSKKSWGRKSKERTALRRKEEKQKPHYWWSGWNEGESWSEVRKDLKTDHIKMKIRGSQIKI